VVAAEAADVASILPQADYAVVDPKCGADAKPQIEAAGFELGAKRDLVNPGRRAKWLLYFRR
jgi:hypothetical protein